MFLHAWTNAVIIMTLWEVEIIHQVGREKEKSLSHSYKS